MPDDYPSLVLFSFLEADVGILCACMPGLFVFIRGVLRMARGMDPMENTRSNYSAAGSDRRTRLLARPPDTVKLDMTVNSESKDQIL